MERSNKILKLNCKYSRYSKDKMFSYECDHANKGVLNVLIQQGVKICLSLDYPQCILNVDIESNNGSLGCEISNGNFQLIWNEATIIFKCQKYGQNDESDLSIQIPNSMDKMVSLRECLRKWRRYVLESRPQNIDLFIPTKCSQCKKMFETPFENGAICRWCFQFFCNEDCTMVCDELHRQFSCCKCLPLAFSKGFKSLGVDFG